MKSWLSDAVAELLSGISQPVDALAVTYISVKDACADAPVVQVVHKTPHPAASLPS
jgi:hypothetical protein